MNKPQIKPKTWKHNGVFGPAEICVWPSGMVGLNGRLYPGLSIRLDEDFSGAGLIDLDTARWLLARLPDAIRKVEAAQAKETAEPA